MFYGTRIIDTVNFVNPHNYRKDNLVYIGTPKCGSRYYTTLLTENGWRRIHFWEINWDKDHTVGFIRDPLERYLKGIVQDIIESENEIFDECVTKLIGKFNQFNLPMTPHSVPITILFHGYYDKIDWIPIGPDSHDAFIKICKTHNIELGKFDSENVDPHHSTEFANGIYQRIKKEFGDASELFHLFFDQDQKLYNNIKNKFDQQSQS